MNAYELADYLDNNVEAMIMSEQPHLDNAANMLRQQADKLKKYELRNIAQCDRIAILEAQNKQQADRIAELEKQSKLQDDNKVNAEPVAMRYDFDGYGYQYIDNGSGSDWQTRIKDAEPLYTTPHHASDVKQTKPLSDDWQPDVKFEEGVFRFDLPNGDEFVIVPPKTRELGLYELETIQEALMQIGFTDSFINYDLKDKANAMLNRAIEERHGIK